MSKPTPMDPGLRNELNRVKECIAAPDTEQRDVVQAVDQLLAYFDKLEEQRTKEFATNPRCSVASVATHGVYQCTRDRGHDGPCAAEPVLTSSELKAAYPELQKREPIKPLDLPRGLIGALNDVWSFHTAMDLPVLDSSDPKWPGKERAQLRWDLIQEEVGELFNAMTLLPNEGMAGKHPVNVNVGGERKQLCDIADSLADIIYVCVGAALEFGIPLDEVWKEVQRANMAKQGGPVRADGKRLKPKGWTPPDIERAVFGPKPDELALASAEGRDADPG